MLFSLKKRFSTAPNVSSYTNVVHVTMSTDNILHKPIENKFNIQTCSYTGHGRCSRHEVNVHQRKEIKLRMNCC